MVPYIELQILKDGIIKPIFVNTNHVVCVTKTNIKDENDKCVLELSDGNMFLVMCSYEDLLLRVLTYT